MESQELLEKIEAQTSDLITEKTKGFVTADEIAAIKTAFGEIEKDVNGLKSHEAKIEKDQLKAFLMENSEVFKEIKSRKGTPIEISLKQTEIGEVVNKAVVSYPNIGDRDYLGQIDGTIYRQPVRRTSILDLFATDTVNSEYLHYWEQTNVTRDAKFVVACAPSVHDTSATWAKRTVELAKIRDMVDVCIDMLEDYNFMESELRRLLLESIQLVKEAQLLTGTVAGANDLNSIASIASEFNPANPLLDFTAANGFQEPNLEQLVDAMSAQISIFGQLNWDANVVVLSLRDYVRYKHLKDANGNRLIQTISENYETIAGKRVVVSPLVAPNTLYIMDATKGRFKRRKGVSVNMYYENKDNAEKELVTMKAVERCQFHVSLIDRNAFMKCSDIEAALTAITRP